MGREKKTRNMSPPSHFHHTSLRQRLQGAFAEEREKRAEHPENTNSRAELCRPGRWGKKDTFNMFSSLLFPSLPFHGTPLEHDRNAFRIIIDRMARFGSMCTAFMVLTDPVPQTSSYNCFCLLPKQKC